ncbi:MAG: hypothetical protein OHK0045_00250 [Raineya sp.]
MSIFKTRQTFNFTELLKFLPWDSQCFGYKVGEIFPTHASFEQVVWQAYQEAYTLLYLRAKPEDIAMNDLAKCFGGTLVDEKITFIQKNPETISYSKASLYQSDILDPQIVELALQSGEFSRFRVDKNFRNNEYEKLYTKWIHNSVRKEIAKEVIIYEQDGKIVGLLTLYQETKRACVGLLAVDKMYRGQGIAQELLHKASELAHLWHTSHLQIVTQKANKKAVCFYEKKGFAVEKIENMYHFWL